MAYLIVHGSGLAGPPRAAGGGNGVFTQWGPDGIFGRGQGRRQLGAAPAVRTAVMAAQAVQMGRSPPEGAHGRPGFAHSARGMSLWGLRGLGGLGEASTASSFAEQGSLAQSALNQLAAVARGIELAATDVAIKGMASAALKFAQDRGPVLVKNAVTAGDATALVRVQEVTKRLVAALKPEVVPALLSRWMTTVVLGPMGAALPAEAFDKAREEGRAVGDDIVLPTLQKTLGMTEVVMFVGGLFGVGYLLRALK